jgi:DNA invertase Pin-like site-specific DNA recombinase
MFVRYISYLRVSTSSQGKSGLGLEAQRETVSQFINSSGAELVHELVEVESGRKNDRPKLHEAIALCKAYNATLLVANLSRLARNAHFLIGLQESGVQFTACDNPQANQFTVGILALVTQQEAEVISHRTKAALAAAKARDTKLGGFRGRACTAEDIKKATMARTAKAKAKAANLKPLLDRINPDGSLSLNKVARILDQERIPTASGRGTWNAKMVSLMYKRLEAA